MGNKQTILGAGGAIGSPLAKILAGYTDDIRLVSRKPEKVNPGDELWPADLTSREQVTKAVEGSSVVYLVAGLKYDIHVWEAQWPVIMQNVIEACKIYNSMLVFIDNIYMYDPTFLDRMTEETPINPPSRKGRVRAQLVKMIMDEVAAGTLTAQIARAADFYGPSVRTSVLIEAVFKPLSAGKKATWFGHPKFRHSYTFTPDAAEAVAILGNTPDAYNQVWHLPTAYDPPTGKQWIEAIAAAFGTKPAYLSAPKTVVRMMGLFMPIMKEMVEMVYQYNRDYVFDSTKFVKRFNYIPTPYLEGIRQIIASDYKSSNE